MPDKQNDPALGDTPGLDQQGPPAPTQESLQARVTELELALEAEEGDHRTTKQSLADALGALSEKETELAQATELNEGQAQTIEQQDAKILALQTTPAEFPTIKVGGTEYEVRTKSFKYEKVTYTLEQLLGNKKLQAELVKKGVGFLTVKGA